jgi:hypothetical protein
MDELATRVRGVDPVELDDDGRTAYWLNAYNLTLLRALAERPRSGRAWRHRRLFSRSVHSVGGLHYSLDVIEHGLLRGNRRPPYGARRLLRHGDPRLLAAPMTPDPRIHFALNCGARSCPPVRVYTDAVNEELERATRAYLGAESRFDPERGMLVLPGLMRLYRGDFGGRTGIIEFAARHLGGEAGDLIASRADELKLVFARFDWTMEGPA